jgi:lysozyme
MADSRIPGPLNPSNQLGTIPSRTPGPLGYLDQGDPNVNALLGDTPGSLGLNDGAAKPTNNSSVPLAMATVSIKRLTSPWTVSKNLLEFLGTWENGRANGKNFAHQVVTNGFILTVYEDSKKLPTVGCGHLVVAADNLKLGDKISVERAVQLLTQDLAVAEQRINSIVVVPLHQYEYDALVSVAFNCGRNGVKILADFVSAGDYHAVPAFIETYRLGGGNKRRRKSEAKLFKSGKYDASH